MSELVILCRNATTFNTAGELDEDAFRQYLHRLVDSKIGVYLASGGSGEGHALTHEELGRVYRIGVETCKGKVQVNGNPPDQHTARATLEHALYAVACGVEIVNLYGKDKMFDLWTRQFPETDFILFDDCLPDKDSTTIRDGQMVRKIRV